MWMVKEAVFTVFYMQTKIVQTTNAWNASVKGLSFGHLN
jgi:hypothetical protein